MTFKPGAFAVAVALILAYCTAPVFAGHGMGVMGLLLLGGGPSATMAWFGIFASLGASFLRWELASLLGPVVLAAALWSGFVDLYGEDKILSAKGIGSCLVWSVLFHLMLLISIVRTVLVWLERREYERQR
ncbi:MAG: hypothetical protein JF591_09885 [Lysobacter sp.]|nr:hypothetical protein [Lysobacter sp.]